MRTDKIEKPDYYTQREWNRIRAREKAQARATRNLVFAALLMLAVAAALFYGVWYFVFRSHDTGLRMQYDMESAAVYSIARRKLSTHAMQFYRVVSDEGITDALTSVDLTDLVRTMVPVLKQACDEMEENTLQKWKEPAEFSMYAERLHCSETMKHELSDLIHYADNAGLDWKNLLNEMAGDIPDRQQGKEVLHAFRSRLCE